MFKMECYSCKALKENVNFVYETENWKIFLHPDQSYLGRSIITLKRHCEDMAEIKEEEWLDFSVVVRDLESAIRKAFDATMFNWGCLMNDAYQISPPNPHVHWHFRPRYKSKIQFHDLIFEDPDFGHHYDRIRNRDVSDEIKGRIIEKIRENL